MAASESILGCLWDSSRLFYNCCASSEKTEYQAIPLISNTDIYISYIVFRITVFIIWFVCHHFQCCCCQDATSVPHSVRDWMMCLCASSEKSSSIRFLDIFYVTHGQFHTNYSHAKKKGPVWKGEYPSQAMLWLRLREKTNKIWNKCFMNSYDGTFSIQTQ